MSVSEAIAAGQIGGRLWLYTNYHCNLRCRYCLTESAPGVDRRELGYEQVVECAREAYAVAIAVFLVGRDRRRLRWVVPLLGLTAISLVLASFHVPVDLAGGAIVGLAVALPVFGWLRRSESRRAVAGASRLSSA